jgi:hypothetical protein
MLQTYRIFGAQRQTDDKCGDDERSAKKRCHDRLEDERQAAVIDGDEREYDDEDEESRWIPLVRSA